jgi:hypothetical protein
MSSHGGVFHKPSRPSCSQTLNCAQVHPWSDPEDSKVLEHLHSGDCNGVLMIEAISNLILVWGSVPV